MLVPLIEAFELALVVETSSAKPHLMIYDPLSASRRQRHYVPTVKTHYGHDSVPYQTMGH